MKAVADTNVLVSAVLSPAGVRAQVIKAWENQQFELVVSEAILDEYEKALNYREVASRHGLNPTEVADIIAGLRQFATLVEPTETLQVISADPADDKFLAGQADYIISGDPHLLNLGEYRGNQILSPREFLALLGQQESSEP